jgi:hypothetical protein
MIYEQNEGEFRYNLNGETFISESVWMIASRMSPNRWVIISHGPEDKVKTKYDEMVKAFSEAGFHHEIDDMYLLDASDFNIEEINKCIEITNYIGYLIEADIFCNKAKELLC